MPLTDTQPASRSRGCAQQAVPQAQLHPAYWCWLAGATGWRHGHSQLWGSSTWLPARAHLYSSAQSLHKRVCTAVKLEARLTMAWITAAAAAATEAAAVAATEAAAVVAAVGVEPAAVEAGQPSCVLHCLRCPHPSHCPAPPGCVSAAAAARAAVLCYHRAVVATGCVGMTLSYGQGT